MSSNDVYSDDQQKQDVTVVTLLKKLHQNFQ